MRILPLRVPMLGQSAYVLIPIPVQYTHRESRTMCIACIMCMHEVHLTREEKTQNVPGVPLPALTCLYRCLPFSPHVAYYPQQREEESVSAFLKTLSDSVEKLLLP